VPRGELGQEVLGDIYCLFSTSPLIVPPTLPTQNRPKMAYNLLLIMSGVPHQCSRRSLLHSFWTIFCFRLFLMVVHPLFLLGTRGSGPIQFSTLIQECLPTPVLHDSGSFLSLFLVVLAVAHHFIFVKAYFKKYWPSSL